MEQMHVEESHNTMEFATRAKRVVNTVSATETMTSAALLKRQAKEIDKLKDQLRDKGYSHFPSVALFLRFCSVSLFLFSVELGALQFIHVEQYSSFRQTEPT